MPTIRANIVYGSMLAAGWGMGVFMLWTFTKAVYPIRAAVDGKSRSFLRMRSGRPQQSNGTTPERRHGRRRRRRNSIQAGVKSWQRWSS